MTATTPDTTSESKRPKAKAPNLKPGERLLLTTFELAALLSLNERTVQRLNSAARLPGPLHLNGSVRWSTETIRRWIQAGCPDRARFNELMEATK